MRVFCIGDVHAQAGKLDRLLARLDTIDANAELWFVGDLVNRGPDSAGVIRRVRALGKRATTILGNHDLSVLAMAAKPELRSYADAGIADLLAMDDAPTLLDWLRSQPLVHRCRTIGWTMVHAGLPSCWTLPETEHHAREFENALASSNWRQMLSGLFGNTPALWHDELSGDRRLRYIANALTRQRYCHAESGALELEYKRDIASSPAGLVPWFAASGRRSAEQRIVFGHWSALNRIAWPEHNVWCVDAGVSWGGSLVAMELTPRPRVIQVG